MERLFAALRAWSERTTSPEDDLRLLMLADIGPYDADEDTESNLSTIEQRVKALVDEMRISERFLIVALIREIEDTLAARGFPNPLLRHEGGYCAMVAEV